MQQQPRSREEPENEVDAAPESAGNSLEEVVIGLVS